MAQNDRFYSPSMCQPNVGGLHRLAAASALQKTRYHLVSFPNFCYRAVPSLSC